MHMPAELAVWTTGHDLKALSALWNYVGAGTGLNLPGTVVLGGWPAFPWGQIGKGPMPPKLMVLVEGGVGVEMLELKGVFSSNTPTFRNDSPRTSTAL